MEGGGRGEGGGGWLKVLEFRCNAEPEVAY